MTLGASTNLSSGHSSVDRQDIDPSSAPGHQGLAWSERIGPVLLGR